MKKFMDVEFEQWFVMKMKSWEVNASINPYFSYKILKETEKAICFEIKNEKNALKMPFKMWAPKSAIIKF